MLTSPTSFLNNLPGMFLHDILQELSQRECVNFTTSLDKASQSVWSVSVTKLPLQSSLFGPQRTGLFLELVKYRKGVDTGS